VVIIRKIRTDLKCGSDLKSLKILRLHSSIVKKKYKRIRDGNFEFVMEIAIVQNIKKKRTGTVLVFELEINFI
jgi:hypothetical protein